MESTVSNHGKLHPFIVDYNIPIVKIYKFLTNGGKNSADRSLLVDLMYWVSQNPPPAHLFLISGDRDFASILHRLRMNNYNILLASPENAPGVLCSAASIMWPWHALLTGENLTGKYFNQPPDGPYGSWYGHYKVPLEDPYSVVEPPAQSQTEKLSEPGSDSKPRPIPTAVMKQIRQILKSHPKGISITDLRMELGKCNLSIDRDFYGEKSSEPCQSNLGMSTESIADNGGQDLSLASRLDCEHKSINVSANRKLSSPASHESNVEDPNRELQQPFSPKSDGKSMLPPSPENVKSSAKPLLSALDEKSPSTPCTENVKTSVPIDGKVVEVAKEQDNELHFPPAVAQGSSSEVGYFKTRSHDGQEDHYTSGNATEKEGHDTPVKQCTSVGNSGQRKDKEKLVGSTSQVVDQAPHISSSSSYNESDKDNETATSYETEPDEHSLQEHMLFSKDSFWRDMGSFMDTPKGSVLASESRTRKKWVEESPSQTSPFKLTYRDGKSSLDHSNDTNRYGYHLDLHMLGYQKLSSLLQMMPGVKVESSYIIPACKTPKMFDMDSYVRNIQKQTVSHTVANSDSELSDASTKDDVSDSPWEELGPVANTLEKYEVEVASRRKAIGSTDGLSDSEGETSPLTELEGEGAARVNKEDSSLLQILDSWYSGKDGRSSKERSENFEGLVDFTNVSKLSVSSGVGPMNGTCSANKARKQRPQKNYSFVADSGDNKDKLFDGIILASSGIQKQFYQMVLG
ncbi:Putative endonuclease or glycosyl hydrolase [Prunus dulcis]|uniref:Endonuclease or glycosyl hydrolase n=1 Tax=Prunus dulcis TaxID=3755 RepID=A0A4Y1RV67_PRUDU|nr:Putative endonuclease or glycosyl hydrolase [Prunus dulcis]